MASPSTRYFPSTSDPLINGMTTGYFWLLDSSRELDFSISNGFSGEYWTSPTSVAIHFGAALETVSIYANIDFNYLGYYTDPLASVSWGSELNLSLSQTGVLFNSNNTWAMGFFPDFTYNTTLYPGAPGDIYLNISSAANSLPSYEPGSQGWFLLLHEIGHTLGLKHPHDDGGTGRPTFTQLGIEWLDKDWATMMSYNDDGDWNDFSWDPATPMILDVLALQYLYGKNLNFNISDSVYSLSETNFYYTLWDADGTDTLDASGALGGWEIYLPEIAISTLVDTKVGVAAPIGLSAQTLVWLAGDYENVIGSEFADEIEGNLFNNFINGGSGNDVMYGGGGNDTFDWDLGRRSGNDTMYGGLGDDTFVLSSASDSVVEYFDEGTDFIWSDFTYSLTSTSHVEGLYLFGTGNNDATGNNLSNSIRGNSGNNLLSGDAGSDTFVFNASGNGLDTITDIAVSEIIKVLGANFSGAVYEGDGSSAGLNQIQIERSGGITSIYIGTDSVTGYDLKILITGSYSASQFLGSGQNITLGAYINSRPTGAVSISGTALQGQILTASHTLADIDGLGTITYQWRSNGSNISGAIGSSFTLTQAEVGKAITVVANYTDQLGSAESVASGASRSVEAVMSATFTAPVSAIDSIGLSPDGQFLLIRVDGVTQSVPIGSSLSFNGSTVTTSDLTSSITVQPVFRSSGGSTGYALPEVFTGPESLNLDYQLIENAYNAVVIGGDTNDFIKVASSTSTGKAVDGGGGDDVIDGGVGSTFISGGLGSNTIFLDGRAPGVSWSTVTDFKFGQDKATIWGWKAGVSTVSTLFTDFNTGGAAGYTGLTLHFENLLPDGAPAGQTNSNFNSITLTGLTLADFGATSLADLNAQISAGTNSHFIVGQTVDAFGEHGYLFLS